MRVEEADVEGRYVLKGRPAPPRPIAREAQAAPAFLRQIEAFSAAA
jgi:hypothetical protein